MTTRYTVKDVRMAFESLAKGAKDLGIDVSKWRLHEGSSTYGRAYRLYDDGMGVMCLSQGFLGLTASEAHHTLVTMSNVLYWIKTFAGTALERQAFSNGYQEAVTAYIRTGLIPPLSATQGQDLPPGVDTGTLGA